MTSFTHVDAPQWQFDEMAELDVMFAIARLHPGDIVQVSLQPSGVESRYSVTGATASAYGGVRVGQAYFPVAEIKGVRVLKRMPRMPEPPIGSIVITDNPLSRNHDHASYKIPVVWKRRPSGWDSDLGSTAKWNKLSSFDGLKIVHQP